MSESNDWHDPATRQLLGFLSLPGAMMGLLGYTARFFDRMAQHQAACDAEWAEILKEYRRSVTSRRGCKRALARARLYFKYLTDEKYGSVFHDPFWRSEDGKKAYSNHGFSDPYRDFGGEG